MSKGPSEASMYSAIQRFGTLVSFFFSNLITFIIIIGLSNYVFFTNRQPNHLDFTVKNVDLVRGTEDPYMNKPTTLAEVTFNLNADFSPLFHWNVKQLFVYITMEYATESNVRNEQIIWDKIISSPKITGNPNGAKLIARNARNKYVISDIADELKGTQVSFKVHWETVSHIGMLKDTQRGESSLLFPTKLGRK